MNPANDLLLPEEEIFVALNRKGLGIKQNPKAPCFSGDALLLADFGLKHLKTQNLPAPIIGDFGTGTGIIALLCAFALPKATVYALELMRQMAALARRNVALNNYEERIKVVEGDICQARALWGPVFDSIFINPP